MSSAAPVEMRLATPMGRDVADAIERLRRAPDVQRVAVMPDVHLATDVCIGVAMATSELIYPQAVGGDIGCGMLAVALDADTKALTPRAAGEVLAELGRAVPARRRNRRTAVEQPREVADEALSDPKLEALRRTEGVLRFATLGSGNHFLEVQADKDERLWLMIHSGSRAVGPAIRDHYLALGSPTGGRLRALEASSQLGAAYLHDADAARRYAEASRRAMAREAGRVFERVVGSSVCWETEVATDHNHVSRERFGGKEWWVHRKGAMRARKGESGVLPGSMGTLSFHVEGRGEEAALCSSAHGAGRKLSRTEARSRVSGPELRRQMEGVWFDYRMAGKLRDEAPAAYKDVRAVLRAQKDLVRVTRSLRPVLNYKGG